jgi:hypothetical protein
MSLLVSATSQEIVNSTPLVKTQSHIRVSKNQVPGHTTSTTGLAQLKEVARDNGLGARD